MKPDGKNCDVLGMKMDKCGGGGWRMGRERIDRLRLFL